MHSVPLVCFHFVLSFSVVLDNESHYMTSYNLVFYCSIKKETVFAITCARVCVCVHVLCHGDQFCVYCAVPNEHIRLGVCQCLWRAADSLALTVSGRAVRDTHIYTCTYANRDSSFAGFLSWLRQDINYEMCKSESPTQVNDHKIV